MKKRRRKKVATSCVKSFECRFEESIKKLKETLHKLSKPEV